MYESFGDFHKPVFSSNSHSKFTHIVQSNSDSYASTDNNDLDENTYYNVGMLWIEKRKIRSINRYR